MRRSFDGRVFSTAAVSNKMCSTACLIWPELSKAELCITLFFREAAKPMVRNLWEIVWSKGMNVEQLRQKLRLGQHRAVARSLFALGKTCLRSRWVPGSLFRSRFLRSRTGPDVRSCFEAAVPSRSCSGCCVVLLTRKPWPCPGVWWPTSRADVLLVEFVCSAAVVFSVCSWQ